MTLANVALTNTFDEWRIRTNQLVTEVNDINSNVALRFISNNSVLNITSTPSRKGNVYVGLAFSTDTSDTATNNIASASSVNSVSNLAVAASLNSNNAFNKANAANLLAFNIGLSANAYANLVWSRSNTYADAVGTSANAFASATIAGANAAVGTGANTVGTAAFVRANTTLVIANLAFDKANSANLLANEANLNATYANTLANTANTVATSGLALAITANNTANAANFTAIAALQLAVLAVGNNTPALALAIAQSAFSFANTTNITAEFANNAANAAFTQANTARTNSNTVFDQANTSRTHANAGFTQANAAFVQANTARTHANAAFGVANNALPNSTVTLAGSLESIGYLNATSGLYSTAAGTPARPSISWKNDIHTGLSRPSSNTLTISTAAAGRIHIDSNGYVGIGTSSPSRLLDVTGNTEQAFTGIGSISGNVLTISSVISGQINVGHYISDENLDVIGGTYVKDFWTGSGGLGTYNLTASQSVSSTTLYGYNLNNSSIRLTSTDSSVNVGQPIGMIEFASDDADLTTDERARAFIYAVNEQANAGVTLMFGTAVGAREAQERLRINRFGAIGLGGKNFGTTGQVLASNGSTNSVEWMINPGLGANAFTSATIAGANTAVGAGANTYANLVWSRSNTRADTVGTSANAFTSATIAGANTISIAAFNRANASLANTTSYTLTIDNLVITGNLILSGTNAVLDML